MPRVASRPPSLNCFLPGSITLSWILLLLAVLAMPALGDTAQKKDPVVRHLEALEADIASRPIRADESDRNARILHRLRFLKRQAESAGIVELDGRLRQLERRVRGRLSAEPENVEPRGTTASLGALGGTVRAATSGALLAGAYVEVEDQDGYYYGSAVTNAQGVYSFTDLPSGTYFAWTSYVQGYVNEVYDNIPCPEGYYYGCDLSGATPIQVTNGSIQVDFALTLGSSITGTVTSSAPGQTVNGYLTAWNAASHPVGDGYLDSNGNYTISGLAAGTYFVTTEAYSEYADEIYDDIPCPGACDPTTGTPIVVGFESTTSGIDFELEQLGGIAGLLTDDLTGLPIPWMDVAAYDTSGSHVNSSYSDEEGRYLIGGLPAGTYFVKVWPFDSFEAEVYDDIPCPSGSCSPTIGTPITVAINSTTSGIDFVLAGGCLYSETALCLNDGRFRVETEWKIPGGNHGSGQAYRLTEDTGVFWFFDPQNLEVFVKLIDACSLPGFNNFWVFSGGMTDVDVTMTVTDTKNQQFRVYRNEQGQPFLPIQDTAAFLTCP
ncbi:MAG: carboxypeptidase regulatory-like domain-containing protein [Thermoanaerobaculia bacterium]|nr:carboxypeptidase regulatory-like domain-containing protein [Thermoanaerobaculia bacterium]